MHVRNLLVDHFEEFHPLSTLSLPNSGALPMISPPQELYLLLLITGIDYLTQDLTSALYSSTLVKHSTQSPTDPTTEAQ